MKPMLSIIIPVHNAAPYLGQGLQAVLGQSLQDMEVIVVDDASEDDSLAILRKHANEDKRLQVFSINKSGAGAARNYGLQKAAGEFVGFADADDWPETSMFEKLHQAAVENEAEVAMCFPRCVGHETGQRVHSAYFEKERQKLAGKQDLEVFGPGRIAELVPFISVVPWNKIYSRHLLERSQAAFAEALAHEDLPFFIAAMVNTNRLVLLRQELYNYRVLRSGSVSHQNSFGHYKDMLTVLARCDDIVSAAAREMKTGYSRFKISFLLTALNGAFRSPKVSKEQRLEFFENCRTIFKEEPFPQGLSPIDQMQYRLVRKNQPALLRTKTQLDQTKEKFFP